MQALECSFSSLGDDIWDPSMIDSMDDDDIPHVSFGTASTAANVDRHDDGFFRMADELGEDIVSSSMTSLEDTLMMESSPAAQQSMANQIPLPATSNNIVMGMVEDDKEIGEYNKDIMMTPPSNSKSMVVLKRNEMGRMPNLVSPDNSFYNRSTSSRCGINGDSLATALQESVSSSTSTSQELNDQYMASLQKLAESMKRSEVTRKQILQYRKMSGEGSSPPVAF